MRSIENPVSVTRVGSIDETITTHPSFSQIGAARVSGGAFLYGSDFAHQQYITISIRGSELHRGLSRDWHHARAELIEVALSEAQWATLVSSLNVGSGVPCTLQHKDGVLVPGLPKPEAIADTFKAEMLATMGEIQAELKELIGDVASLGLGKAKAESLHRRLSIVNDRLVGNTTFVAKQFGEHVEKVVESAKIEVNAYVMGQVARAGLDALNAPISMLEMTPSVE